MYALVVILASTLVVSHALEKSVVLTYDEQQREVSGDGIPRGEALSFNCKIYDRIKEALSISSQMPDVLCSIMASFLKPDWSAGAYMEDPSSFMPDGYLCVTYVSPSRIAAGTSGRNIHVWDLSQKPAKLAQKLQGHTHSVASIDYNQKTNMLASGSYDGSVRIWPALSQKKSYKLEGDRGIVRTLSFLNSTKLVTGSLRALQLFDLETQQQKKSIFLDVYDPGPTHVAKLNDNAFVAIVTRSVLIYDETSLSRKNFRAFRVMSDSPTKAVAVMSDALAGDVFAVACGQSVELFDTRTLCQPITHIKHTGPVKLLAMCGKYLASSAPCESTIKLWDVASIVKTGTSKPENLEHVFSLPSQGGIALAANQEGSRLAGAVTGAPGFIQAWNLDHTK